MISGLFLRVSYVGIKRANGSDGPVGDFMV
jgi:hypothetical protein